MISDSRFPPFPKLPKVATFTEGNVGGTHLSSDVPHPVGHVHVHVPHINGRPLGHLEVTLDLTRQ